MAEPLRLRSLPPTSTAERIRALQAEARSLAGDHVRIMVSAMCDLSLTASEIADGGSSYSPGVREAARQLHAELEGRIQTLSAIQARMK